MPLLVRFLNWATEVFKYAAACFEGILLTGEGSAENPYQVTRPSDEYDLIVYLRYRITGQRLHQEGERRFDLLGVDDGSEIWFDVTDALTTATASFIDG